MSLSKQEISNLRKQFLRARRHRWKETREKCESRHGLILTTKINDVILEFIDDCEYLARMLDEVLKEK